MRVLVLAPEHDLAGAYPEDRHHRGSMPLAGRVPGAAQLELEVPESISRFRVEVGTLLLRGDELQARTLAVVFAGRAPAAAS